MTVREVLRERTRVSVREKSTTSEKGLANEREVLLERLKLLP